MMIELTMVKKQELTFLAISLGNEIFTSLLIMQLEAAQFFYLILIISLIPSQTFLKCVLLSEK